MFRKKAPEPIIIEWVIVGLGNPGPEYSGTRHNVGFEAIDGLAEAFRIKIDKAKHKARIGIGKIDDVGVVLVKPMTYMNVSGQAVVPILKEHGIDPSHLLVISDDLDMNIGRVRLKPKGSAGGHNGHKSIMQSLGTQEYPRLKIGIHSENRSETVDFVLSKFTPEEKVDIQDAIKKSVKGIKILVSEGLERGLNALNEGS
jgi:peptidyl-tRNA hydrolase, PTH1 family